MYVQGSHDKMEENRRTFAGGGCEGSPRIFCETSEYNEKTVQEGEGGKLENLAGVT